MSMEELRSGEHGNLLLSQYKKRALPDKALHILISRLPLSISSLKGNTILSTSSGFDLRHTVLLGDSLETTLFRDDLGLQVALAILGSCNLTIGHPTTPPSTSTFLRELGTRGGMAGRRCCQCGYWGSSDWGFWCRVCHHRYCWNCKRIGRGSQEPL